MGVQKAQDRLSERGTKECGRLAHCSSCLQDHVQKQHGPSWEKGHMKQTHGIPQGSVRSSYSLRKLFSVHLRRGVGVLDPGFLLTLEVIGRFLLVTTKAALRVDFWSDGGRRSEVLEFCQC